MLDAKKMNEMATRIYEMDNKRVKPVCIAYVPSPYNRRESVRLAASDVDIVRQYAGGSILSLNDKINQREPNDYTKHYQDGKRKQNGSFYVRKWRGFRSHSGYNNTRNYTSGLNREPLCDGAGWSM